MTHQWVLQQSGCEIGNFMVTTPALRALSELYGEKIGVHFNQQHVADLNRDCPFIEHLSYPVPGRPLFSTRNDPSQVGTDRTVTEFYFQEYAVKAGYESPMPPWYCDAPPPPDDLPAGKKVAVIHGGLAQSQLARKDVGRDVRVAMICMSLEAGYTPIIIGSNGDWQNWWSDMKRQIPREAMLIIGQKIRDAMGAALACDLVLVNDTGFSHLLAGPHERRCLIMARGIEREWIHRYKNATYCMGARPDEKIEAIRQFLALPPSPQVIVSASVTTPTVRERHAMNPKDWWVDQTNLSQVGNFHVMTPAIRALSKVAGKPIGVHFDPPEMGDIYRDCPFMTRLKTKPGTPPILTSDSDQLRIRGGTVQEAYWKLAIKYGYDGAWPGFYVDNCKAEAKDLPNGPKVAIIHGGRLAHQLSGKSLTPQTRVDIVRMAADSGFTPIILGNQADWDNAWRVVWHRLPSITINRIGCGLRQTVAIGQACDGFVANDTGLSHVFGGGSSMRGAVLGFRLLSIWRHPYPNVTWIVDGSHTRDDHYRRRMAVFFGQLLGRLQIGRDISTSTTPVLPAVTMQAEPGSQPLRPVLDGVHPACRVCSAFRKHGEGWRCRKSGETCSHGQKFSKCWDGKWDTFRRTG